MPYMDPMATTLVEGNSSFLNMREWKKAFPFTKNFSVRVVFRQAIPISICFPCFLFEISRITIRYIRRNEK